MHLRTATPEDAPGLLALASTMSALLSVVPDDLQAATIEMKFASALQNGLVIVAQHPSDEEAIVGFVMAHRAGDISRKHVYTGTVLLVHPDFQQKKMGRTLLTIFLEEIGRSKLEVGKVEIVIKESNRVALQLFQSMGFLIEGRWEMRVKNADGSYEAEIPMGWTNPNFEFDQP